MSAVTVILVIVFLVVLYFKLKGTKKYDRPRNNFPRSFRQDATFTPTADAPRVDDELEQIEEPQYPWSNNSTATEVDLEQIEEPQPPWINNRNDDDTETKAEAALLKQCELYAVRPVNKEASRVFYVLKDWIADNAPTWHVSFEVSMGAFVRTKCDDEDVGKKAFRSYQYKRVDFLLMDNGGRPKLVIEYNGSGHDISSDTLKRMAIKRMVLKQANIPLLEVSEGETKRDISDRVTQKVEEAIALQQGATAHGYQASGRY